MTLLIHQTGEIHASKDAELTEEIIDNIKSSSVTKVKLLNSEMSFDQDLVINTLKKDSALNKDEALYAIYRQLRSGEAPDLDTAAGLIEKIVL